MRHPIDHLLAPVASRFRHAADEILDLREAALERNEPGDCLACYFKIFDIAKAENPSPLQRLREWLEANLVVVARDQEAREIERLPVSLHQTDLESFCRELMDEFRDNRSYQAEMIELSLRFNDAAAA